MTLAEIVELKCGKCGGELKGNGNVYQCVYCHAEFAVDNVEKEKEALAAVLDGQKQEKLANLRRLLWTEIHEEYIDSEKIVGFCAEIRKIMPEDFSAIFFELANGGSEAQINAFLRQVDFSNATQKIWAEEMVKFMLKSLRAKNLLAVQHLIEKAFKDCDLQKYEKYSTVFSREAERVSGGVYEPSLPRDVFVAYSSKNMKAVEELVEMLEERGLTCFVAARNLQHGRGATANYQQALEKAMSACRTIVFVSSKYSRSMACDAVRIEIPYFMEKDKENAPYEYRQRYDKMPIKYKKPRVEYRLDNAKTAENSIVKEFFGTLEYAYSKEEVAKRIEGYLTEKVEEETATKTPENGETDKKYQELLEEFSRLQAQMKKGEIAPIMQTQTESKVSGEFRREGNYAYFGTYPQSEGKPKTIGKADENGYFDGGDGYRYVKENGKYFKVEPIKWRILEEEKGKVLLHSEKVLDAGKNGMCGYMESPVRAFLLVKFLKKAFTESEREKILETKYKNQYGGFTTDKIFLPTLEDFSKSKWGFLGNLFEGNGDKDWRKEWTNYVIETQCQQVYGEKFWLVRWEDKYSSDKTLYVNVIGEEGRYYTVDNQRVLGYVPALWVKTGEVLEKKEEISAADETQNELPVVEVNEVSTKKELTKGVLREGGYIWFGEYPQSKKATNVVVYDAMDKDGYHRASDGCRYIKARNGKHYKVEPIKWRILYEDGKTFKLLADKILGYSWRWLSANSVSEDLQKIFDGLVKGAKGLRVNVRKPYSGFLGEDEIKERLSLLQRLRKPTAFASFDGNSMKSWWVDYESVVTSLGMIKKSKTYVTGSGGGLCDTRTNVYGIVPCITIEILE